MMAMVKSWLIKIFLGLIALSFAVWGIGDIFRGSQDPVVATVGSVDIHASQLSRAYNRELDQLRQVSGGRIDAEQARALGIVDRSLQTLMTQSVVDQQAEALGIRVSNDMILEEIRRRPEFLNESGRFDAARFAFVLSNHYRMTEEQYLAQLNGDLSRAQFLESLFHGIEVPARLVSAVKTFRSERRVVEATIIDAGGITDLPTPDDTQIDEFYRANESRFTAPEYRTITYVLLRPVDLLDEIEIDDAAVQAEYEIRLDDITIPEKRDIDMFVLSSAEDAAAAHDRIRAGEDFLVVGAELTDLTAEEIAYGLVTERDLLDEQAAAVFALATTGVAAPIALDFDHLLVRVNEIQPGRVPTADEVGEEIRQDLKVTQAVDAIYELGNAFEDELAGGATLEEAAEAVGATVQRIGGVDRQGLNPDRQPFDPLPPIQNFLNVAFQTDPGLETQLTEAPGNMMYSLRIDDVTAPALRPLADVREEVIKAWQEQHKRDFAKVVADQVATAVKNGTPLADAAGTEGFEVATSTAFRRDGTDLDLALAGNVVRSAFDMALGETSDALPNGVGKYAVIKLSDIQSSDIAGGEELTNDEVARELRDGLQADIAVALESGLGRVYTQTINRTIVDNMF